MDERELETLLREAPAETPPATFELDDVTAASRRQSTRRRSMIAVACSFVVLAVAGVGAVGVIMNTSGNPVAGQPASGKAPALSKPGQPDEAPERLPKGSGEGFPDLAPKQGGDGSAEGGPPRAESTARCDKVDRELATALAGELPVTDPGAAQPGRTCTNNTSSVIFQVPGGELSAVLSYPPPLPGLAFGNEGTPVSTASAATAQGGRLTIVSTGEPGSGVAPLADELAYIAHALAPRF